MNKARFQVTALAVATAVAWTVFSCCMTQGARAAGKQMAVLPRGDASFVWKAATPDGGQPPKYKDWADVEAKAQGNAHLQFLVGLSYLEGLNGVKKDKAVGLSWINRAVENGDGAAESYLGCQYMDGSLVPKDLEKAEHYLRAGIKSLLVQGKKQYAMDGLACLSVVDAGLGLDAMQNKRKEDGVRWFLLTDTIMKIFLKVDDGTPRDDVTDLRKKEADLAAQLSSDGRSVTTALSKAWPKQGALPTLATVQAAWDAQIREKAVAADNAPPGLSCSGKCEWKLNQCKIANEAYGDPKTMASIPGMSKNLAFTLRLFDAIGCRSEYDACKSWCN